jgi:hypothetical protein
MFCLGNKTCLIPPTCDYQSTYSSGEPCLKLSYYESSLDKCPTSMECTADQGCDRTDSLCAYCPSDGSQCIVVEGVNSSDVCRAKFACELPDGEIRFDLTAEECVALPGSCSGECPVPICRPRSTYFSRACYISNMTDPQACSNLPGGIWYYYGRLCISFDVSQADCDALRPTFNVEFTTCEIMNVSDCNSDSLNYVQMAFLNCGVSDLGPCDTQELCESIGGTCSDAMSMPTIHQHSVVDKTWQFEYSYGLCSASGTSVLFNLHDI